MVVQVGAVGAAVRRVEGVQKVRGEAHYAYEEPVGGAVYAAVVQSTIARGEIRHVDPTAAMARPGVLAVVSHENAPHVERVDDGELWLFQSPHVSYRGQLVAVVVAETSEAAREAAHLVAIDYAAQEPDVDLRADRSDLERPDTVNAGYETDTDHGDFEAAFAAAPLQLDETYTTPAFHNNPMEPHATVAEWRPEGLLLHDSSQGAHAVRDTLAKVFALDPEQVHVVSRHVGGGFGSKGMPHPHVVCAALAARAVGRPVRLALTRQEMFAFVGYRTPTIQRLRLGATADGQLTAIGHDVVEQCSTVNEFAEQTATPTRVMYAAPNRHTAHRLARLDVPSPSWMRAPGECPGMFALESAMDELAAAAGLDPVELRVRNEPDLDPEKGIPFSSRNLVACLREGASRFGWEGRDPTPAVRREGRWLVGTGVASSTYPAYLGPGSATARLGPAGRYTVRVDATDIGTGARTALSQLAADALGVPVEAVTMEIGDSKLPVGRVAGGSAGTASWGWAVVKACQALRNLIDDRGDDVPSEGLEASADTTDDVKARDQGLSRHAFGAQFAEARVDVVTGEVRVPRMAGVFAAGHIVNPLTARSQLVGGMTMGLSMALHEESVIDRQFGDYLNRDLADYHVAANADVGEIDVAWVHEDDPHLNPMGTKGIGEIGIVGTAAAIANAVHHATGIRVRDLPIRLDRLLDAGL